MAAVAQQKRGIYDARKEYETLVEKYKEAGGCVKCLREGRYLCDQEDVSNCEQKKTPDHDLFTILRTSILDNRERIFSTDRQRAELQIPCQSLYFSSTVMYRLIRFRVG